MSKKPPRKQNRGGRLTWLGGNRVFHALHDVKGGADSSDYVSLRLEVVDFLAKLAECGETEAKAAVALRRVVLDGETADPVCRELKLGKCVYYRCLRLLQEEMAP